MSSTIPIGALAKQSGLTVETLRFYEREGLLDKAARNASGYRNYGPDAVQRLQFIRRAQELGFTLAEIRELIALQSADCRDACAAASAKLATVEAKLADLTRMRAELTRLVNSCDSGSSTAECAIIECLTGSR